MDRTVCTRLARLSRPFVEITSLHARVAPVPAGLVPSGPNPAAVLAAHPCVRWTIKTNENLPEHRGQ